jgi:SAM-dependent methyltransferase
MDRQSFLHNGGHKYNGARSSLSGWFSTAQGAYVLDWELAQFDSAVEDVFGFRAVQIGLPQVDFLRQNRIPFRFTLALEPGAALAADPLQLPLASQSVDLLVLPHALEEHAHPHEVLREAERVLMPEGQVVISGFNTASLWRLRQMFSGRHREAPDPELIAFPFRRVAIGGPSTILRAKSRPDGGHQAGDDKQQARRAVH